MELISDIKNLIVSGNLGYFRSDSFCKNAAQTFNVEPVIIEDMLKRLVKEGFLVVSDGKYVLASSLGLKAGKLDVKPRGFGFCIFNDGTEDVFIPIESLSGAIHGDRVLIGVKQRSKRVEGYVDSILERTVKNVVGTIMQGKSEMFIIPDDERLGQSLPVVQVHTSYGEDGKVLAWSIGDKVVARFDGDLMQGTVHIVEVLGSAHKVGVDILSIIRQYNLYQEFPKEVNTESKKVAVPISEEEIKRRVDFRDKLIITIDPEDAKDLDDAISIESKGAGLFEVGVHIADVAHYVEHDSELDKEAFKRGTSVYFPNMVLPMLPKQLSNDVCSLHPGSPRLALSCMMTMDLTGEVLDYKVVESVIDIKKRFSYNGAQEILEELGYKEKESQKTSAHIVQSETSMNGGLGVESKAIREKSKEEQKLDGDIKELLNVAAQLTFALEKKRRERGEVIFDVPEPKIVLDPKTGKIKDVIAYPHLLAHRVIETLMVLCNECVAKKFNDLDLPFVYRIHEKPNEAKVFRFLDMLKPFAVQHSINPQRPQGHDYGKLISNLPDELRPIISSLALRSMQKAKYSPNCLGHFGLGAKYYCHFTSPIRRYPDLIIHRIIKLMINRKLSSHKISLFKDFVEEASEQSSKTELTATEAEREVDNLKRAEYMNDHIGAKFSGIINGITDFGVFVYLPNTVEGLIKIENMPKDKYTFNDKQMTLVGTRRTYKMGDKIDVIVAGVDMVKRKVEFRAD